MKLEYMESITVNGGLKRHRGNDEVNSSFGESPAEYSLQDYFPPELIYSKDLIVMIYKKQQWESMCDEAKIIAMWVCTHAPDSILISSPGYTIERRIAAFFRKKWGRLRVSKAIREIKKFASI